MTAEAIRLPAEPGDHGPRALGRVSRPLARAASYVVLLGGWQLAATYLFEPFVLPSPLLVAEEMWSLATTGVLWPHLLTTGARLTIGFAIALSLGVAIGVAMGRSRYWDEFFRDYIMLTLTTPGLVFALICAMIFGLSPLGPIVAIVLTAMPHVTANVVEGVRAIPRDLLDMASAYRVPRSDRIRQVVIPAVAPYVFTSVRYGFAIAWKITALTEIFGSASGIGFQIRNEFLLFSMRGVLAWALVLVLLAVAAERLLLVRLEARFFRWRPAATV